jgi:glycosyl transferase family 87
VTAGDRTAAAVSTSAADIRVPEPSAPRRPVWRMGLVLVLWLLAFAVTRLLPLTLTMDPSLYGPEVSDPNGDIRRYAGWASAIVADGQAPYREVDIEYPPGSLPFVMVPALVSHGEFSLGAFLALMMLVDAAGFVALLLLARRTGSYWGVVTWLVLPPLLGVLLYGRLDLIPAVALLLALEQAYGRRWVTGGVWLGLGAAAKLVPGLFLPLGLLAAKGGRLRLLGGVALGAGVAWLPFAGDTGELLHDVLGYHSARGIHLESMWGSLLNLQRIEGAPVSLVFEFGAFHIAGPGAATMLRWTTILSLVLVFVTALIAAVRWWRKPERAGLELPLAVTATLALLLGTGRVFSPQFMVWLLAASAVLFTVAPRVALWAGPLLAAIVVLTALGYPLAFDLLRQGERWPALLLVYRNMAVIAFGLLLLLQWWRGVRPPDASTV